MHILIWINLNNYCIILQLTTTIASVCNNNRFDFEQFFKNSTPPSVTTTVCCCFWAAMMAKNAIGVTVYRSWCWRFPTVIIRRLTCVYLSLSKCPVFLCYWKHPIHRIMLLWSMLGCWNHSFKMALFSALLTIMTLINGCVKWMKLPICRRPNRPFRWFLSKLDHLRNERYWASNQSEKDKAQRRLENNRLVIKIASALKWCGIFVVRLTILPFCTRCNRCSVVWKAALEWISIVEAWSNKRLHQGFACITSYDWPNVSNVAYLAVTRLCCQCNLRLHSTSNVEFRTDGFGTAWTVNPLSSSVRMALAHLDVHQLSRNYQRRNRFFVLMEAYGYLWLLGVQLKLFFPYQSVTSARRCTIFVITSVIGKVCFILIYICASSA